MSAGPANGPEIARFSPSGADLLYWVDPLHSASLAADGLGLLRVPAAGGASPKMLAVTLPHPSWVQPHGQSVLIVAGAGREATTNQRIATCDAKTGSCAPLQAGQGQVALDPAGLAVSACIAYITAKDHGQSPRPMWFPPGTRAVRSTSSAAARG